MSSAASALIDEPVDIAILDYGMGNRRSVEKALEHVGVRASITPLVAELLASFARICIDSAARVGEPSAAR